MPGESSLSEQPVQAVGAEQPGHGGRAHQPKKEWRRHRDWTALLARLLCGVFALIGLVPLGAGMLVQLDSVQEWTAAETAKLLEDQLGLDATYEVELRPWPLLLALHNIEVQATDGGTPFLSARRVVSRPLFFSLLAGKLNLGEVEIEEPRVRAVIRNGELRNLSIELPETGEAAEDERVELPLRAVSLTNALVDVTIDDLLLRASALDVDLSVDAGPIELAVRVGRTEIDSIHDSPSWPGEIAVDEDVLCNVDLRARWDTDRLLVRRLHVQGAADFDPLKATRPPCDLPEHDWRQAEIRIETFDVHLGQSAGTAAAQPRTELQSLSGRIWLRAPVALVHRWVKLPHATGWVSADLDATFHKDDRLPTLKGNIIGHELGIDGVVITHHIEAQVDTSDGLVHVTDAKLSWGGANVKVADAVIRPLAKGAPLEAKSIDIEGVKFFDLLDDVATHPRAHVDWTLVHTHLDRFGGTLDPVNLAGPLTTETRDFGIYDRPANDPQRHLMMGVTQASVRGTFGVTPEAIVLSGFSVVTPGKRSSVSTTVSIGFKEILGLTVNEGSFVDLHDVSPLVDIPFKGLARMTLEGGGHFDNPVLEGKLTVDGFEIADFPLGDITESRYRFEPLVLELTEATLQHRTKRRAEAYDEGLTTAAALLNVPRKPASKLPVSIVSVPRLSLDFESGPNVLMRASVDTRTHGMSLRHFFEMTNLDSDPRTFDLSAVARGAAEVEYLIGGERDRCGGGWLEVRSSMHLDRVDLWGESYSAGEVDFDFLWDDFEAGDRGMVVDVHSMVLRKDAGTVVGRASVRHGAQLQADLAGAGIPLHSLSLFQEIFGADPPPAQPPAASAPAQPPAASAPAQPPAPPPGAAAPAQPAAAEPPAQAALKPVAAAGQADQAKPAQPAQRPPGPAAPAQPPATEAKVRPEATMSFVANVGGRLDAMDGHVDVHVSKLRIGPDTAPPSWVRVAIVPSTTTAPPKAGKTRCGNDRPAPFSLQRYLTDDTPSGVFSLSGELFGGQIAFDDLQITQQRDKLASTCRGDDCDDDGVPDCPAGSADASCRKEGLRLNKLDLGLLANLLPGVAFSESPPKGTVSAVVHIDELPIGSPSKAEFLVELDELQLRRDKDRFRIGKVSEALAVRGDQLQIPPLPLTIQLSSGVKASLQAGGTVSQLSTDPQLDLWLQLPPVDLSRLGVEVPEVERASGAVQATLALRGSVESPQLSGELKLVNGALRLQGLPLPLEDIDVDVQIADGEIVVRRAEAKAGSTGFLSLTARMPINGLDLGEASADVSARNLRLPIAEGVLVTADASLHLLYDPAATGQAALPHVTGQVSLTSFTYSRPMSFNVASAAGLRDIEQMTSRRATAVDIYNPEDNRLYFDIMLESPRPVRLVNNLVDMKLDVSQPGLRVVGTDQRFGAIGSLQIQPGSKMFLQGHDFVISSGLVEFDDTVRIVPKLDVHADTEYRRYATADIEATAAAADTAASGASSTGGKWRIAMHAFGDTEAPQVRFTSDPPLSQDDIVLLLQIGMTRAELDRGLFGSLAQSVGIEALSAFTGLDQAVRKTVPLIDEFRVGSQYSSRTGQPEPTLSVGKRITEDVRASVTTGLSEQREIRSNIEWKWRKGVSLQGSWDNVNDVSSSALGNVGADLRWRLEFE